MGKDLHNQNNNNDEVDLVVLFNYIGDKINNFFSLILRLFTFIFSIFIYGVKAILDNLKIILTVIIVAAIVGFILQKRNAKVYESKMLVRTYFDAKYQLATNINYYNALIGGQDYKTLSSIFGLDETSISQINAFEMISGPETENERIVEYDTFLKSIDSTRAKDITFDDFIENRDLYTGNLFEIRVESKKKDIFKHLEEGINKSFENQYSTKKMQKRDSMIVIKKENILASIQQIDSLKKVYIKVLENESESAKTNIGLSEGLLLKQEKSSTKEYQLLDKEIQLRNELRELEEQKLEENVFFDVISSFQVVGKEVTTWRQKYALILPFLAFALLCVVFLVNKFTIYVKNYDA